MRPKPVVNLPKGASVQAPIDPDQPTLFLAQAPAHNARYVLQIGVTVYPATV